MIGVAVLAARFPAGAGEPLIVGNPVAATRLRAAFADTTGITHAIWTAALCIEGKDASWDK